MGNQGNKGKSKKQDKFEKDEKKEQQKKRAEGSDMEEKQIETELIRETGAVSLERNKQHHRIELLTIIGEIEGHDVLSGNTKARKEFNRKQDRVKDKEEFYRQLAAPDVLELKEEQLLVAKDYVVVVDTDVEIYDLNQMEKLEVGKQGTIKKTLFLTEPGGKRHAILSTTKGDGRQRAFDQVYERLHNRY